MVGMVGMVGMAGIVDRLPARTILPFVPSGSHKTMASPMESADTCHGACLNQNPAVKYHLTAGCVIGGADDAAGLLSKCLRCQWRQ